MVLSGWEKKSFSQWAIKPDGQSVSQSFSQLVSESVSQSAMRRFTIRKNAIEGSDYAQT